MTRNNSWIAKAAVLVVLGACSSSSDDKSAGSAGAVDSCNRVCEKQAEKMCPNPLMISVDECKQLCAGIVGASSAACQAELKAQSDCQLMAADVCTSENTCRGDGGTSCM